MCCWRRPPDPTNQRHSRLLISAILAQPHDWVQIGQLGRPHGVRGELRLHVWGGELPADVKRVRLVSTQGATVEFVLQQMRPVAEGFLVKLTGVDDRDEAAVWRQAVVEVSADLIEPAAEGEYYLYEILGASVQSEEGQPLGTASAVLDHGGQDVLSIRDGEAERLLPIVPALVKSFDRKNHRLLVSVPPGYWDGVPS